MSFYRGGSQMQNSFLSSDDGSSVPESSCHGDTPMPFVSEGLSLIPPPSEQRAGNYDLQESCVFRNFPKRRSAHLRFLAWVAYKRRYANSITDLERKTCPLLFCRDVFDNEDAMLQHIWHCQYLAKGLYWCYDCQKVERVGKLQCKRCQEGPSRTDRLANVAKKIFSLLGARAAAHRGYSHQGPVAKPQPPSFSMDVSGFSPPSSPYHESTYGTENFEHIQYSNAGLPDLPELPSPTSSPAYDMATRHVGIHYEMDDQTYCSEMAVPSRRASVKLSAWSEATVSADTAEKAWNHDSRSPPTTFSPSHRHEQPLRLNTQFLFNTQTAPARHDPPTYYSVTPASPIISPLSPSTGIDPSRLNISPTDSESSSSSFNTMSDSGYTSATSLSRGSFSSVAMSDDWKIDQMRSAQTDRNLSAISEVLGQDGYRSAQHSLTALPIRTEYRQHNYSEYIGSTVSPVEYQPQEVASVAPPYRQSNSQLHQDLDRIFNDDMIMDEDHHYKSSDPEAERHVDDTSLVGQLFDEYHDDGLDIYNHGHTAAEGYPPSDSQPGQGDWQEFVDTCTREVDKILRHKCDHEDDGRLSSHPPAAPTPSLRPPLARESSRSSSSTNNVRHHRAPPQQTPSRPPNPFRRGWFPINPTSPTLPTLTPFTNSVFSPPAPPPPTPLPRLASSPPSPRSHPTSPSSSSQPIPPPCPTPPPPPPSSPSPLQTALPYRRPLQCRHLQCRLCGYEPGGEPQWRSSNLRRHMRTIHSTKRFKCSFKGCESSFSRTDNLRAHQARERHGDMEVILGEGGGGGFEEELFGEQKEQAFDEEDAMGAVVEEESFVRNEWAEDSGGVNINRSRTGGESERSSLSRRRSVKRKRERRTEERRLQWDGTYQPLV